MFFKTLQFKVIALVLAIVLVSNIAMEIISRITATGTVNSTVIQLMESAKSSVAARIADENSKQYRVLESLATMDFIREPSVSLSSKTHRLKAATKVGAEYENICFYDKNGDSISAAGTPINMASREYFVQGMKGNRFVDEPFVSPVNNKLLQHYAVPVYDYSDRITGVMTANVWGENLSNMLDHVQFGKDPKVMVLNRNTGLVVASTDVQEVFDAKNMRKDSTGDLAKLMNQILSGQDGGAPFNQDGKKMVATWGPVEDSNWTVLCMCSYNDFFGGLKHMLYIMNITLLIIIAVSLVVSGLIVKTTLTPLLTLRNAITEIASGDADLTRRINARAEGEIGNVVSGFNKFIEKLQEIISQIKDSKDTLGTAGIDLEASTEDTSSSITQILANIESVRSQVNNQSESVHQTAGAVNQIASNIESLDHMIEKQSNGVSEASAAVEEMIGNIRSVNTSVAKMSQSFTALAESAQNGVQVQTQVNQQVEEIRDLSKNLQEANTAIASIASQTNLLAMNAAIEAAHAGEAGKGFSVVADEIRKLSETSTAQSKTIGNQLKSIKKAITSVVEASSQSNAAFQTVSERIHDTDEIVRQIQAAMQEQDEGSQQISSVLHNMNDSSLEVRNAGKEMMEGNKSILEEVHNLQNATTAIQSSMEEMTNGARKINETGVALSEISKQVKQSIDDIGGQIDKFTV